MLRYLKDHNLVQAADSKNPKSPAHTLRKELDTLCDLPCVGDVRGLGLMAGVELVSDRARKTPAADVASAIQARLLEEGFLAGVGGYYGNVLRVQPPLVIEDADLDRAVAALDRALAGAAR